MEGGERGARDALHANPQDCMEAIAMDRAKAIVGNNFCTMESLDEIYAVADCYAEQLTAVSSDLHLAISKYDESIQRAGGTIKAKVAEIWRMKEELNLLFDDGDCDSRQKIAALRWFSYSKQLGDARNNIESTLRIIDGFLGLPEATKRLRELLREDPASMKRVVCYVECMEDLFFDLFLGESSDESESESGNGSTQATDEAKYICPLRNLMESVDPASVVALKSHFDEVLSLSEEIRSLVEGTVSSYVRTGADDQELLVRAIETMSLIAHSDSNRYADAGGALTSRGRNTFEAETMRSMERQVAVHIQSNFASFMFKAADAGKSGNVIVLGAATNALADMIVMAREVAPCFPIDFKFNEMYRSQFETYIFPQLTATYHRNCSKLEIQEILALITWIDHYVAQMQWIDSAYQLRGELAEGIDVLKKEYLSKVKAKTASWLSNIRTRSKEVLSDSKGRLYTPDPEDILKILEMQTAVARERLPASVGDVTTICAAAVRDMLDAAENEINLGWEDMSVEVLCAVVNDCARLSENLEATLLGADGDKDATEELCMQCIQVAVHTVDHIVGTILVDLKEPCLRQIGTQTWADGGNIADIAVRTFQDYFKDLQLWLPDFFFVKCVRRCAELALKGYIEGFFGCSDKDRFRNRRKASCMLRDDGTELSRFFKVVFASFLEGSRLDKEGKQVEQKLEILGHMAKILDSACPQDVQSETDVLLQEFGRDRGVHAVLNIVKMREGEDAEAFSQWRSHFEQTNSNSALDNSSQFGKLKYDIPDAVREEVHKQKEKFWSPVGRKKESSPRSQNSSTSSNDRPRRRPIGENWSVGTPTRKLEKLKEWSKGKTGVSKGFNGMSSQLQRAAKSAAATAMKAKLKV